VEAGVLRLQNGISAAPASIGLDSSRVASAWTTIRRIDRLAGSARTVQRSSPLAKAKKIKKEEGLRWTTKSNQPGGSPGDCGGGSSLSPWEYMQ
jgi:hypothetical protein